VARTLTVMRGDIRAAATTKAAFQDGVFKPGDIARQDSDGYLHFVAARGHHPPPRRDRRGRGAGMSVEASE
jgi:non-ribosomal peptide synthetase component E (peptide arylation enzyme)